MPFPFLSTPPIEVPHSSLKSMASFILSPAQRCHTHIDTYVSNVSYNLYD